MGLIQINISTDASGARQIRSMVSVAEAWAADKAAGRMLFGMQAEAPVDTGLLWSRLQKSTSGGDFEAGSYVFYAVFQEYGTRFQSGTAHVMPTFDAIPWDSIAQGSLRVMGL